MPFEVLYNMKSDYSYLRVFGHASCPCLRPYSAHKFEPRTLQCIFLGYNADYKGYRCLYPPTGRVYISRHIIFDDELFPLTGQFKHLIPKYPTALLQGWRQASVIKPKDSQIVKNLVVIPSPAHDIIPQDNAMSEANFPPPPLPAHND